MLSRRIVAGVLLIVCIASVCGAQAAKTDKTLVSWVTLTNKAHRAGSILTVQVGGSFDGIVFAEKTADKWMSGSDWYRRTQKDQDKNPPETADSKTVVQMGIVYKGDRIEIYRNGKPYAAYTAKNIDLLSSKGNIAVFGVRHVGGGASGSIAGVIEDARIYARALTAEQLKALQPNKPSTIKPYAWWDFEGDKVKDRAGRFLHSRMKGAKLSKGKLVLAQNSVLVATVTEAGAKAAIRGSSPHAAAGPYVEETPAMPASVPANWLTYHLAHPGPGVGFPGDPNCAFFYKGRYHLHYIYRNRHGFAFAHVSGTDMVHWKWHPTVLVGPKTGHGMFSGTGFFTKEGKPAIIYHGQGSGRNHIAYALDDNLDKWTMPEPVMPTDKDGKTPRMRHWDPDCWRNGDTFYALSGGGNPQLLKSEDLKKWKYLGDVLHKDFPTNLGVKKGEDISCANTFKIGSKWMLLCISHRLGCRYYLGDFKDEKYLPDFHAMMNWNGWDFFAPESMLAKDGRRVMWAWCKLAGAQSGIQSLPRELSLPKDGVLRIKPLRELEKLRYDEKTIKGTTFKAGANFMLKGISGDTIELAVTIKPTDAKKYGVTVFCDKDGKGFPIAIDPGRKALTMGRIAPPFELAKGEDLKLRIFLDKSMVEVFVNDRQAAVYMVKHDKANVGVSLFSEGGQIHADVKAWKMKTIYTKASPAPK